MIMYTLMHIGKKVYDLRVDNMFPLEQSTCFLTWVSKHVFSTPRSVHRAEKRSFHFSTGEVIQIECTHTRTYFVDHISSRREKANEAVAYWVQC